MPTANIKDIPESRVVKLVDLSDDSINKIVEAVVQKIAAANDEIVRCKDCKWWDSNEETCIENDGWWRALDFCSWAERKENETN